MKDRIYVAISAAGAFRSDDAGASWLPINKGLRSGEIPDTDAEVGHCVHHITQHPSRPDTLFMQKHWDVMRSDDAGANWREISGDLPSDFGFPIAVHAHEPETIYVVPITSDSRALPAGGQAARLPQPHRRRRLGAADQGPAAGALLRQRVPRRDGGRHARPVRHLLRHHRRPGLPLGRRRRHVGADRAGPAGRALRGSPGAAVIRVVLPAHLKTLASVTGEVRLDVDRPGRPGPVSSTPSRRGTRCCSARSATAIAVSGGAYVRFYACEEDLSNDPPDTALPDRGHRRPGAVHHPRRDGRRLATSAPASFGRHERPQRSSSTPTRTGPRPRHRNAVGKRQPPSQPDMRIVLELPGQDRGCPWHQTTSPTPTKAQPASAGPVDHSHYLHTAYAGALLLQPRRITIVLDSPHPATAPEALADFEQAMAWFTAEHAVLLAAVGHAERHGLDTRTWQIAWTLETLLSRLGYWRNWSDSQITGLAAAQRCGDVAAQARAPGHRRRVRAARPPRGRAATPAPGH